MYSLFVFRTPYRHNFLKLMLKLSIIVWVAFVVFVFRKFAVLSYGTTHLTSKEILRLRWRDTWDFIIHKT